MKDWTGNSKSTFSCLGASSHSQDEREENDFYATDPKAIDYLLRNEYFPKDKQIWECACGTGHLSERLKEHGYNVYSSDLVDRGYQDKCIDFLTYSSGGFNNNIITNPPYKYASEFVLKALEVVNIGCKVAMFLKIQFVESEKRFKELFSKYPPKTIHVFVKRIQCAKNGEFKGTRAVCYAWFVWEKGLIGATELRWINNLEDDNYE